MRNWNRCWSAKISSLKASRKCWHLNKEKVLLLISLPWGRSRWCRSRCLRLPRRWPGPPRWVCQQRCRGRPCASCRRGARRGCPGGRERAWCSTPRWSGAAAARTWSWTVILYITPRGSDESHTLTWRPRLSCRSWGSTGRWRRRLTRSSRRLCCPGRWWRPSRSWPWTEVNSLTVSEIMTKTHDS